MGVLNRKLRRDLFRNAGVLLTVVAIIAVGTGAFIGFGSAQRILEISQRAYYRHYRMADFWVDLKKAPLPAVQRVAQFPEVAFLEARVVFDVILDLPHVVRPISGRLISVPPTKFERTINGVCLVRGSGFSDQRDEEVILGESFANAHGLDPGDRLELILNRKRQSFVVVGTAISPEYVYTLRSEGDLLPDPAHFAILYIKENYARDVLGFQDACNQIVGLTAPGRDVNVDSLLERIDRVLDPYGVLATTPRSRQPSHRFLSDEIAGLGATAVIIPSIFLAVAALALNVLMTRMAQRQRTIIGTLKALGYSHVQVMLHFLAFGVVVGVLSGAAGCVLGLGLTAGMIEMYRMFYQFPRFLFELQPDLLVVGMIISVIFAVIGTTKGVWAVLRLQPAEAMRPKPPERGSAIFLERFPRLWRSLGFRNHMVLRTLVRNPGRTLTTLLSATLASAIVLLTFCMYDSTEFLVDFQFELVAHSDVDIGMRDEKSIAAVQETANLPAVDYAEPLLGLVCDLRHGKQSRRMVITGLSEKHRLTTPMQANLEPIMIPDSGLVLSRKLAELLDVSVGDRLELTPVRGRREAETVYVASIVDSFLGLDCYANLDYLSRIVGEALAVNSVQTDINPDKRAELYAALKRLPNAQGLSVRADTIHNIRDTFVKTMLFSLGMMILFAGVISLGSTLNSVLVEIQDRLREISTLRVLGYTPGQVSGIFFRQNLVVSVLGFVLSLPLSYLMAMGMVQAYNTELYRMPLVYRPRIIWIAAAIAVIFLVLAQFVVHRQIRKLDWQEGVKIKE